MNHDDLKDISVVEQEKNAPYEHVIHVCVAASCLSSHSDQVKTALELEVKARNFGDRCKVKGVGCMGLCAAGPLVAGRHHHSPETSCVVAGDQMFQMATASDAPAILDAIFDNKPVPAAIAIDSQLPFFTGQKKIVLENCGEIDPDRIEDYISVGGYDSLFHALSSLTPTQVVEQVSKSGLRGRGGAGFPTGLKWSTVAKASATDRGKYVICNADEGDPGAFMDRTRSRKRSASRPRRHGHRRLRRRRQQGLHLLPRRISAGRQAPQESDQAGRKTRRPRQWDLRNAFQFPH